MTGTALIVHANFVEWLMRVMLKMTIYLSVSYLPAACVRKNVFNFLFLLIIDHVCINVVPLFLDAPIQLLIPNLLTFLDHTSCAQGVDAVLADTSHPSTTFCGQGCQEVLLFFQVFLSFNIS